MCLLRHVMNALDRGIDVAYVSMSGAVRGFHSLFANNVGWGDVHGIVDGSLLQRQFSINQIVTDCKALPFPEIVAGVVVCGHPDSDFRQADRTKRLNHAAHQNRANASTTCVGVDRRVVDARPSSVVAGKNRANDSSVIILGYETGVAIAFEKRLYCILAIVYVPHSETCASCPQSVCQRIVLDFHMAYGHCDRFGHISPFLLKRQLRFSHRSRYFPCGYVIFALRDRLQRACRGSPLKDDPLIFGDTPDASTRQRHGELCLTGIMHVKNGSVARAAAVVTATGILCGIVPMIGAALRNSAIATMRETNILQALAVLPEGLRDCSTVLAYLFSTVGCIAIVAALAAVDSRITGSRRVVIRDAIVSAAPILYVIGVKWLVERPRPITSAVNGLLPDDPSFPSGHTAAAVIVSVMMILTVRNFARKCFPDGEDDGRANRRRVFLSRAVIGAVALVVAVACSRLLLGLHYPTDVIIPATICPLISYAVWCVWNAYENAGER